MRNTSFKPLFAFIVALFIMATGEVRALPQGGKVESGRGDLSNPAHIIQNSSHLQTSWHSFDIGKNEVVNIAQPSAAASIVIGVRNGLGTNINGTLNANGRVTLENPAGVQFGRSSVVNVGGLLATTGQGALSSLGQITAANKVHLQNLGGNIVNIGGAVSAQEITVESNGDVVIGGTASLSAGNILIGGDYQGKGAIANARTTRVEAGASIDAGVKGRIIVWSDDYTYFGGSLNAPKGFAEVSGKRKLQTARNFFSSVNVGTLLLDPQDITIQAALNPGETQHTIIGNTDASDGTPITDYIILTAHLESYRGGNLVLAATRNITISDALNIGSAAGADPAVNPAVDGFSLTLNAGGDVQINAAVTLFNTAEQLTLTAGQPPANFTAFADGTITVAAAISANDINLLSGYHLLDRNTPTATTGGAITTTATLTATGRLDIRAARSNVTLGAAISGESDVRVVSGGVLALNANVTSAAALELSGVSVTTTGVSGTPIELSLSGAFVIGASGGAIPTLGTELTLASGVVIDDFTLTYGDSAALTIDAALIDLPSDSFTLVSTDAAAAITIPAIATPTLDLDVDVEGTLTFGGDVAVKSFSGKAQFVSGASITLDVLESFEIRDGSTWATATGGALTITTSATALTPNISNPLILGGLFTVGSLEVNFAALGNALTVGSDFSVTAETTINLNVGGIDRTAGNLSLTTTAGNITLPRTIDVSGGDLTLISGDTFAFNGAATPINFTAANMAITTANSLSLVDDLGLTSTSSTGTLSLTGAVQTSGDFTVTAEGKLLFGNGTNLIQGANVFLTSATAPTVLEAAVITSGTTTIAAPGGTITLNAKINVGTAGELVITTRASGGVAPSVVAGGTIVFGTTAPVELTANILRLHTSIASATGGVLGTAMTTLTATGAAGAEDAAFIEVQGNFLFADLIITSTGGFQVADLGAALATSDAYVTTLDTSGEMQVSLGNHVDAATGGVLASSASTGGTYAHDLLFNATGDLRWMQGGIDNQIGRVRLLSAANTSISVAGASVLKGAGVVVNSFLFSLPSIRRGTDSIWVENTDAAGFVFVGTIIDSVSAVTIESAGHIRFRANREVYIRGASVSYDVQKVDPANERLGGRLLLVADSGNINVTGYLELNTGLGVPSSINLIANAGAIVFGAFTDADNPTVTQTTVTANSIELQVRTDFIDLNNRPANFSVAPVIYLGGVLGGSAVYWQPGPIVRITAESVGALTLTAAEITAAGYTITNGVVDFGTDRLILEAGTTGTNTITLPASVTEIRAGSISIIGTIVAANGLALTSAGALSWVSAASIITGNIALVGADITLGGSLQATSGDFTVEASGKLLFGNGANAISGANVSLTSATAPTAADIAVITSGDTTTIAAAGGTITLNAKINVGAGNLTITTRAASEAAPSAIAAGAIAFGTTDPVELTAKELGLYTSSIGGALGTETTTLTAVGGETAFIEIQGRFHFADLNITSSGGFNVANLGDGTTTYTTTLDASGVMRVNLGNHTNAAMGDVLSFSVSTGGTFTHDLSFVAAGDLFWIQGGIQNNIGSLSLTSSGAAISISTAGASVLKGAGVVITSGGRALADDRRGTHGMWLENTDAAGFLSLGSVINTAGDVTIESVGTITFLAGADASIRGKSVSYTSTVEDTTSKLEGGLTLVAFNGNITVVGFLEVATGASVTSSIVLRAPAGEIMFTSMPKVSANSIELSVQEDFVDVNGDPLPAAPADFSVAPHISLASYTSLVLWQSGLLGRQTAQGTGITITEADITAAGFTIDNGVLDLGNGDLILEAGVNGADTIMLPASITSIRAGFISIIGTLATGLGLTSAGDLSLISASATTGNITLEGVDITLSGTVRTDGDLTVTASGKLLFADGTNLIQGANVSLTSAIAPAAADVSVITTAGTTTTIQAPGGTITLNAKINLGTEGELDITTRAASASTGAVIAAGAIVFGTTDPVELTARALSLHTSIASATGGVRGTETTTLTIAAPTFGAPYSFIEVQGNLLFADLNITSAGGFKVADLGNGTAAYATTLDASGVMRINLHATSGSSILDSSTSTGGTLTHDLSLVAAGDLFWERGDLDNQIGGIRLSSGATTSISTVGRSVLKGEGIEITSGVRSLPDDRRGTTLINLENTDAARSITLNADVYTAGNLIIKSAGTITFLAGADASLTGVNTTYEAAVEATSKLEGALTLTALNGNITVVGFLQVAAGGTTASSLVLRSSRGRIVFTNTPTVSADSILLEALYDFADLDTAPATFNVPPTIIIAGGVSAVSWQAGVFSRSSVQGVAGGLTFADADITAGGYTIDANGVLDLGTDILILRAGTTGADVLTLPATITEIRAGGIVLVGSITSATGLTLTSTGGLSWTSGTSVITGNITLTGVNITISGNLQATSGDLTATASGKLLFGDGPPSAIPNTPPHTVIQGDNVFLTSAIAPTATDTGTNSITFNRVTTIRAPGGTITLNAKISLGTSGRLTITTRALTGEDAPNVVAAGSIVFGTTAPVELTARAVRLETSATGGERGTETTTLTSTGYSNSDVVGVQGNLLFADLNITANGGLKVINLGVSGAAYTTTLDASGEMRVNLRSIADGSTISSGGARTHNLSLVAAGDLFWEKGALASSVGGISLVSGATISFSTTGDSLLNTGKGNLVIEGAVPLTAARRGTGDIVLQNTDATGFISLGTVIDTGGSTLTTAGNVTITSFGTIRFPAGADVSITGTSVTYNVQRDDSSVPKLEGTLTMTALFGDIDVTGYLEVATGGTTASSLILRTPRGGIVFGAFTGGGATQTTVSADSIQLEVRDEFAELVSGAFVPLRAVPADFSVQPVIIFRGVRGASAVLWQADAFGRRSSGAITLTLADFINANYFIDANGVVDLGAAKFVLEAGSATDTITLPDFITSISARSISILGSLVAANDLTLISAGDITFGRGLTAGGDLTVTAGGRFIFRKLPKFGTATIQGANVSLTSALAPTLAQVTALGRNTTRTTVIRAPNGVITLNAKINVGAAGILIITTAASSAPDNTTVANGSIVFGTTAPVELTAREVHLRTSLDSSTGVVVRGEHPTTLTARASGRFLSGTFLNYDTNAFILVQGHFFFTDLNITSTGGFLAAHLGDALPAAAAYLTTLDASGVIRVNLGLTALGGTLRSSVSTGGTYDHDLSFIAAGDLFWEKGGIQNNIGNISLSSGAAISFSTEGASYFNANGRGSLVIDSAVPVLTADRRGAHNIHLETAGLAGFVSLGAPIDTTGAVRIRSAGHIRFSAGASVRGSSIDYDVLQDDAIFAKLEGTLTLTATSGNIDITGYLQLAAGGTDTSTLLLLAPAGAINFGAFTDGTVTQTTVTADSILLEVRTDFTSITTAPAAFSVAPIIIVNGVRGASIASWQNGVVRFSAAEGSTGLMLTAAEFITAGFTIDSGVLDLGTNKLFLLAGTSGNDTLMLPASVTEIRAGAITIIGTITAASDLTFIAAGALFLKGELNASASNSNLTLRGTDVTLDDVDVQAGSGNVTVTAGRTLLFGAGTNAISGANVSLTSAVAPTAADVAGIASGNTTTITAPGGTITLNAKINVGQGNLILTTRATGASSPAVVAAGAIVFGTTAPVELGAKELTLETSIDSATSGVRGIYPTTLMVAGLPAVIAVAADATVTPPVVAVVGVPSTEADAFIEVQGNFLFADLNIISTGGVKVANLGTAPTPPVAYTTTLDASGVMRVNLGNHADAATGMVLTTSTSTSIGSTYAHDLFLVAEGNLFWEKGGIDNQIGRVRLLSRANTSISTAGASVLKGVGVVVNNLLPSLPAARRGAHSIWVENTDATATTGFLFLGAAIDTTGAVTIRSAGHIRFRAGRAISITGGSIDYDVAAAAPATPRLESALTLTATTGNINIDGFLLLASGGTTASSIRLVANAGAIVFNSTTPTPTVRADSILLEALTEFADPNNEPAAFSVRPRVIIAGGTSGVLWQAGVFGRVAAPGAGGITLTAADFTADNFAIDANGVLNLGTTILILHAGTDGTDTIVLPSNITGIRAGSISIIGTLNATANLALEGVNITLSGSVQAVGNLAVTARGKLLFGDNDNTLQGANVSLLSTIAPTAIDTVGITSGNTTTIQAPGGTITLNAKIDVGTMGLLTITTRTGAASNAPIATGTIVFGTRVPVELNAKELRLHTSASSRGGRLLGLHPTILTATGGDDAFIEVQGNFLFARLTVTSTGGFKVADLGAALLTPVTYLTTLHSSRVMRINLGNHADAATGMVLASSTSSSPSSTSTSGAYTHDILFLSENDLFWEKGGIDNGIGRVRVLSRFYTSISREGASVLKGMGITANHRIRPLPANRRGLHNIWVENTNAAGFIFLGAALDTAGDITLTSAGHIRFRGRREGSIRANSISYDVQKDLASAPKLNAQFTLTAVTGNVSVTGYLGVATGAGMTSSLVLSAPEGEIVFEPFTDVDNPSVTQTKLTANNIELDVKDDFTGSAAPANFSVLPVVIVAGADGALGGSGASWQVGVFGRGTAQGTSITITEADITAAGYTITNGVLDLGTDRLILRAGRDGTNNIVLPSSITSIRASFITMVGTIVSETPLTFASAGNLSFAGDLLVSGSLTIEATDVTMGGSLTVFGDLTVAASRKLLFANGRNYINADNISLTSAMAPTPADMAGITSADTALTAAGGIITVNAKINVGSKGELILSTRGADLGAAPNPAPYPSGISPTTGVPVINPSNPSVITAEAPPAPVSAGAIIFGTTAPVELTAGLLRLHTSSDSATNGVRGTYPTTLNAGGTAAFIEAYSTLVSDEFVFTDSSGVVQRRVTLSALRAAAANDHAFVLELARLLGYFDVVTDPSKVAAGSIIIDPSKSGFNPLLLLEALVVPGPGISGTDIVTRTLLTTTVARALFSPASDAFIEVQGNLLFADLNINSTGGIKVADLGDARSGVADYTTTFDASGVMRVNLGNHTDAAAMGSVLGSSTSTGGTLTHDLAFVAGGDLLWEKGGIENQIGGVSLSSNNDTSLSTEGASVLKGRGIVIDGDVPANRRGVSNIWLENTDAADSLFLGVAIDSTGNVTTKSAGTFTFRAGRDALIKGRSVTYDALKEDTTSKLEGSLTLEALEGNVDVTGYLEVVADMGLNSSISLFARKGEIVFNLFRENGTGAQTRVEADRIQLEAEYDFKRTIVGGVPATFNIAPEASISSATGGRTDQLWLVATP